MKVVLSSLVAAAVAACGGGPGGGTSGDDTQLSDASSSSSDAPAQHQGLSVMWLASPALPGVLKTNLTVSSAKLRLERLEVIGDNGQPMTDDSVDLNWQTTGDPSPIVFSSAPSGLYSQVNLHLDGEIIQYSYEISGTTKVEGETKNYAIHDRNSLDVDVKGYATSLSPGGQSNMTVKIDLRDALDSIHFDQLDDNNGTLTLDTLDMQMPMFRMKLQAAFKKSD